MNTVVNKLGFDNGKMRLKSAYNDKSLNNLFYTLLPLDLLSVSDGHKTYTENTIKKRNLKQIAFFLKTGTPTGNRTPVTAVKGRCPNR